MPPGGLGISLTEQPRRLAAEEFLDDVEADDPQELMARLTGNDKHGNERTARNHPRNKGR